MIKDPNCNNPKVRADYIESEVEDCFKRFAINIEETQQTESKISIFEEAIKKSNTKIKKYYSLYAENESDNLMELIKEEEKSLSELKAELQLEISSEKSVSPDKIKEIKRVSDIWDEMKNMEKNRILKECIDRIVITNNNVEVFFSI